MDPFRYTWVLAIECLGRCLFNSKVPRLNMRPLDHIIANATVFSFNMVYERLTF